MRSVFMGRENAASAVTESMGCSCNALGTRARVKSNRFCGFGALTAFSVASIFLLVFGLCTLSARGQATNTGTIIGSVFDNTGAFVPGAKVTITQNTTNAARSTTTDKSGRFVFVDVDPGDYTITVTKQGFATTTVTNQAVKIGTQLNENIKLQLGSVSTTVTVTETPGAELQTLTPTVGTTLSGAIILNLPNTSRDASTLAVLQPGQSINGQTGGEESDQNSFQLDGGYATDDMSGDNNTYIRSFGSDTAGGTGAMHSAGFNQTPSAVIPIPVASVEEFKISTANQTADFNGGGGSQMQLVTKRGTNQFHGSVYDYYQDTRFGGANTWDNNAGGRNPDGTEKFPIVSSHFSRFGGSAGGKIPAVNVLGGGWFLFGNYEGYRFPQGSTFERSFPLPSLRAGIIHLDGQTINLNTGAVIDPGCGAVTKGCQVTAANGYNPGGSIASSGDDPRNLGPNSVITNLWSTYLPLPNDCSHGDGLNYCGYRGTIRTPQSSNFGVIRIDHDFASKWHFNGTYHYYKLQNTVSDQWDVGGFFSGDTMGQYSAIRHKPQQPWLYTAGLTTELTPNVTNNVRFSFTRNFWAYADPSGVPNVAGYPAALEIGGESSGSDTLNTPIFGPYNTNNQQTRTRFWDGKDTLIGDDVSWLKGNHLFQFGGSYLRNNDTHNRNDNGGTIDTYEQYLIGVGFPTDLTNYNMNLNGQIPAAVAAAGDSSAFENLYSMVLGMVDETQSLYTRGLGTKATGLPLDPIGSCAISGIAATSGCVSSPPLVNTSILPTYNVYLTDSWHLKPTFSLNYGLGYTVEMPAYETRGGFQTVMVDQNDNIVYATQYLKNEEQAALQGNAYAPLLGFAAIRDVNGHSKYPYNPFYGGLSPRIGFAWNVKNDTVIRAGYARIFGRLNGVAPVLVPMLTPGLMQPATCLGPNKSGGCGTSSNVTTASTAFRVGVDGTTAPLPAPSANLPQPWYPGMNDVGTGAGETFDPNFKPDRSDEFTLSVQHQFGPKILAEAGYIGRLISNEIQYYSFTNVPYMMTRGGQSFANAWKDIMVETDYGLNVPSATVSGGGANPAFLAYLNGLPAEPFFENSLAAGYCNGSAGGGLVTGAANCTAAFVGNNAGNLNVSDPFDAWAGVSGGGFWQFGRSMTGDPIGSSLFGANGQSPSIITTVSNGYGNYNAGYLQLTFQDWHGLTAKTNFTWSNALGTGNVVQASSSFATVDPWNLNNAYGPQGYNEKYVLNVFLNYAPTWYASQRGIVGHVLGGWSISPLFVYGSGFPVEIGTRNFDCGTFGECNTAYVGAQENGVITGKLNYHASQHAVQGSSCGYAGAGFNVFSNPDAVCFPAFGSFGGPVRNAILGLDSHFGGAGPINGLPFFNLDLGVTKKINVTERMSSSVYFDFTNVLNHMQPNDPCFNTWSHSTWGVLGCGGNLQGNNPRELQLGLSFDW